CYGIAELQLTIPSAEEVDYDHNVSFCLGTETVLSVPDEFTSYEWSGLQNEDLNQDTTGNFVTISHPGNYSVKVTDTNGCTYTLPFEAVLGGSPEITDVQINGNAITAIVDPSGQYEYSLNGIFWQNSPTFQNIAVAAYDIYVRDVPGCLSYPSKLSHLQTSIFSSPHNDGSHDVWKVRGLDKYPGAAVQLLIRYRHIFTVRKGNPAGVICGGIYLGKPVPT